MDRRSYLKTALVLGGSVLAPAGVMGLVGCSGTTKPAELSGFDGKIMGTSYSVRLGQTLAVADPRHGALATQIHAVLHDVDTHMSTWQPASELSLLNASADSDWQKLSASTTRVIAHALHTSQLSQGAFDATVGPLVDLWGFGAGSTNQAVASAATTEQVLRKPSARQISQRMAQVGSGAIEIDLQANAVRKLNADTQLDLSGIAKGYAVDRVARVLDEQGFDNYLVEVGGELKARGFKPDANAWKVAIERPLAGQRDVFRVVDLTDAAIATSGDYRNFFADGGQRYSHSIDPRTGKPVEHALASVSVVAPSTMTADALSTALMVMGPAEAMDFVEKHAVAAHMILKSGSSLKEEYSSSFEKLLS